MAFLLSATSLVGQASAVGTIEGQVLGSRANLRVASQSRPGGDPASLSASLDTSGNPAQGVYVGVAYWNYGFLAIILPDGTFYGVGQGGIGDVPSTVALFTGPGSFPNRAYSAYVAYVVDYNHSGDFVDGSLLRASLVPGASISGSITDQSVGTMTFDASALPASQFNYDALASLADIQGYWSGSLFEGIAATIDVSSNGAFSGSIQGCSYSGSLVPQSSGLNFFDVSFTYGDSPCRFPNQTLTGIAMDYLLPDGATRQLLISFSAMYLGGDVFVANRTTAASYSLTATPVTVLPGEQGVSTVTVNSYNGYAGTISFTCAVTAYPPDARDLPTCTSSDRMTLNSGATSGTAHLMVSTKVASSGALVFPKATHANGWSGVARGAILAVLVLSWIPGRRDGHWLLGILFATVALTGLTACGGGGGGGTTLTMPGTYTLTVTGTGSDAAKTMVTTTFVLTVN